MHWYLPQAEVGNDMKLVPGTGGAAGYVADVAEFIDAYKAAAGSPLPFFHADAWWQRGRWEKQLKELSNAIRAKGVRFGIIYNGGDDMDPVEWTTEAEGRFAGIETEPGMAPDDAIIQSWMREPEHALPETEAGQR